MDGLLGKALAGLMMVKNQLVLTFGKNQNTINLDMLEGDWAMWSEITSIEEIGEMDMIDIEVSGDHLFYANDILTHNSSSDLGLEDTSESFGLPATADFMFGLTTSEKLEELGQIMVKQLKNRYSDLGVARRFVLGIDRSKMRLINVKDPEQGLTDDKPVMDNTKFGEEENDRSSPSKFNKSKFKDFK